MSPAGLQFTFLEVMGLQRAFLCASPVCTTMSYATTKVTLVASGVKSLSDGSEASSFMRNAVEYLDTKQLRYLLDIPVEDSLQPDDNAVDDEGVRRSAREKSAAAASSSPAVINSPWLHSEAGRAERIRREDERILQFADAARARGQQPAKYTLEPAVFLAEVRSEDRSLHAWLMQVQEEGEMRDLARTLSDGSMSGRQLWHALIKHYLGEMSVQQDIIRIQLTQRCHQWKPDDTPSSILKDLIIINRRQFKESDVYMREFRICDMFIRSLSPVYATIRDHLIWQIDYEGKQFSLASLQSLFAKSAIVDASHSAMSTTATTTRVLAVQDKSTGAWRAVRGGGNRKEKAKSEQTKKPEAGGAEKVFRYKCFNCDGSGHKARNCTNPCASCDKSDHQRKNCPNPSPQPKYKKKSAAASSDGGTTIAAPTSSPIRTKGRVNFVLAITTTAACVPDLSEPVEPPSVVLAVVDGKNQATVHFFMDTASPLNFSAPKPLYHPWPRAVGYAIRVLNGTSTPKRPSPSRLFTGYDFDLSKAGYPPSDLVDTEFKWYDSDDDVMIDGEVHDDEVAQMYAAVPNHVVPAQLRHEDTGDPVNLRECTMSDCSPIVDSIVSVRLPVESTVSVSGDPVNVRECTVSDCSSVVDSTVSVRVPVESTVSESGDLFNLSECNVSESVPLPSDSTISDSDDYNSFPSEQCIILFAAWYNEQYPVLKVGVTRDPFLHPTMREAMHSDEWPLWLAACRIKVVYSQILVP